MYIYTQGIRQAIIYTYTYKHGDVCARYIQILYIEHYQPILSISIKYVIGEFGAYVALHYAENITHFDFVQGYPPVDFILWKEDLKTIFCCCCFVIENVENSFVNAICTKAALYLLGLTIILGQS